MLYICKACGGVMKEEEEVFLVCTECGTSVETEYYDSEWEDIFTPPKEKLPEYCYICGGPYPDCMTSCKLFDD